MNDRTEPDTQGEGLGARGTSERGRHPASGRR